MNLEKIVAQAKKGERGAQSALYQQYFQKIHSPALGITKNPEDAMDICQETFLSAFQRLSSLRESAAFPHWLCQIAANQCRRLVKNKGRFLSPEQKEDEPDFFSSLPDDDPETLPKQVLDTLGENPYLQEVDATWRDTQDLTDLSFVQDLPNLRNLYCTIGDNVDLTPLQNCPQLEAYSSSMGQNPPSVPQLDTQAFMDTYTHPLMKVYSFIPCAPFSTL